MSILSMYTRGSMIIATHPMSTGPSGLWILEQNTYVCLSASNIAKSHLRECVGEVLHHTLLLYAHTHEKHMCTLACKFTTRASTAYVHSGKH